MKKYNYISLVMGLIGGILFALGMCMCLLPEWDAFAPGAVMGVIGILILLAMIFLRRKMQGKLPIRLNGKTIAVISLAVAGTLVLGVGMCMVMVWKLLVWGIIVGLLGIAFLLCLIPLCKGIE